MSGLSKKTARAHYKKRGCSLMQYLNSKIRKYGKRNKACISVEIQNQRPLRHDQSTGKLVQVENYTIFVEKPISHKRARKIYGPEYLRAFTVFAKGPGEVRNDRE